MIGDMWCTVIMLAPPANCTTSVKAEVNHCFSTVACLEKDIIKQILFLIKKMTILQHWHGLLFILLSVLLGWMHWSDNFYIHVILSCFIPPFKVSCQLQCGRATYFVTNTSWPLPSYSVMCTTLACFLSRAAFHVQSPSGSPASPPATHVAR